MAVTAPPPVTQDERVTSSAGSCPAPRPAPLPAKDNPYSELRGLAKGEAKEAPLYTPELGSLGLTTLHSPNTNTQQTFLACSAAVELATGSHQHIFPITLNIQT